MWEVDLGGRWKFVNAASRRIYGIAPEDLIGKLFSDPATQARLTNIALEPLPGSTPDSFAAYIKTEVDRWAVIVKNSGAELE